MQGTVFNIQRFSLFDGPGVRTVVFLKGCPLSCKWCHNPEGLKQYPQVMYNASRCIGCGSCAEVCKKGLHAITDGLHTYTRNGCDNCGSCAEACYSNALALVGMAVSADDVISQVMKDDGVYKESGGGVTLSGGEPLMQWQFALEILKKAKENGISTCMETSGYADSDVVRQVAQYTDIFLFDYKATGSELHRELCGVGNEKILANLCLLDELGKHTVLRCPIVLGLNDTDEHIEGIAKTARQYGCVKEIHLEPYHRLGISKSNQLGEKCDYEGDVPDKDKMKEYCLRVEALSGKHTIVN